MDVSYSYQYTEIDPTLFVLILLSSLVVGVIGVIASWKIFSKAGKPGWASLIPFYNVIVLLQIVGRPWWLLLLLMLPFVNIVITVLLAIDLARSFGKSTAFGVIALWFFSFIGYLILAFSDAQYAGPAGSEGTDHPANPPAPAPPAAQA